MIKFIHTNKALFFVFLGSGLLIRFFMLWLIDYRMDYGDASNYLQSASNLFDYGIFSGGSGSVIEPDFYRPPAYPFFLFLIFESSGKSIFFIEVAQIIMSIISAVLITAIAIKHIPNSAIWVFGLMMLSPFEAVYTGAVLSETLTAFLIILILTALMLNEGFKKWIIAGVLLGILCLVRDIYILLPFFFIAFYIFFGFGDKKSKSVNLLTFFIIFCLSIAPWTYRNYQISETFVPVSDGRLGYSLWTGVWATDPHWSVGVIPNFPDKAFRSSEEKIQVIEAYKKFDQEADELFKELAIQRMKESPFSVIKSYTLRQPYLWLGTRFDIFELNKNYFEVGSLQWKSLKILFYALNTLFLALGIYGACQLLIKGAFFWPMAIPIFYTAIIYMPLNSFENRYSQPVYPLILFFAGYALSNIVAKIFKNKEPNNF